MKSKYNKLITCILFLVVIIFSVLLLVTKKESYSYLENRNLSEFNIAFHDLFNDSIFSKIDNYLIDHFPFRDKLVNFKTSIEISLGKDDINNIYLGKDNYLIKNYQSDNDFKKITNNLNSLFEKVNYVNMNLMVLPSSLSINNNLLPKNNPSSNEISDINAIYKEIHFDTINTYESLLNHNRDYQMYYKFDNHLTAYGSYYAYLEYTKHNNLNAYSLNSFDITEVTNDFIGNLYSQANYYISKSDSIYKFNLKNTSYSLKYDNYTKDTLYFEEYLNLRNKYNYFLGDNIPLLEVTNNKIDNDKELLVIGNDYGNSIVPFLINHYKKIYVINMNYYEDSISNYILDNKKITDCLIIYNINEFIENNSSLKIK